MTPHTLLLAVFNETGKTVNEDCCPGNGGLCSQEAWLFLEEREKKRMTHYPFPPLFLPLSLPHGGMNLSLGF